MISKDDKLKKYDDERVRLYKKYISKGILKPIDVEDKYREKLIPFIEEEIKRFEQENKEIDVLLDELEIIKQNTLDKLAKIREMEGKNG